MAKVSLRAYNREIETMIDRGQMDEAIAHCQHILKTFPKHLETYRLLGKAFLEYKRYNDAVDIFSRVLAAEPNDFVANVGMSIIRDEDSKLDDAIWHMERAFEVQPSNAAIQGELQRLYGRREGVQPSRIRMTRGALAHMYVQGELYPQAISEIKSVLQEDLGRSDMQVLLARAYYRSGQKTQAADEASAVLRRYPYCLDANRVLVEILGVDRPENAQVYRQRVIELDPYAAQVSGTIFQTSEVGDAAVTIEHLDWNGQPVRMQSDWGTSAIGLESEGGREPQAQPDWLKSGGFTDSGPQPPPKVIPPLAASTPSFDLPVPTLSASQPAQPTPAEDIPEFLRAAGWGESTGVFDESKSSFANEPESSASSAEPIAQGDLPDWVKAMAPPAETLQPAQPADEEELPDWINEIGAGRFAAAAISSSSNQPDWLAGSDEPAAPQPAADDQLAGMKGIDQPAVSQPAADDQFDWMRGLEQPAAAQSASDNQPEWMKGLEQSATSQPVAEDQPDWMKGIAQSETAQPAPEQELDWLRGLGEDTGPAPATSAVEQPDWLTQFGNQPAESAPVASTPAGNEFDFLDELTEHPPATTAPSPSGVDTGSLGVSEQERDDSFAWLENLAAKQGASEGLLTKPEDRLEEEPEWVKQAKGMTSSTGQTPVSQTPMPPPSNVEELGKSEQERDDSFAWLENLAAKQGATEGLLTKPEERLEQEPAWVQQAKGVPQAPVQPPANAEELGKSEQERDDSFAWLENLAAKQGATEGLLTRPEERLEQEPEWVQQAKGATQAPTEEPTLEPTPSADDTRVWLRSLEAEESIAEPVSRNDETAMWLKKLDEPELESVPESAQVDDMPGWLQGLDEEEERPAPVAESVIPAKEADDDLAWLNPAEEPVAITESAPEDENLPSWLSGLDEETKVLASLPQDDLPAWMRDDTGEVLVEPIKIEPTRPTEWHPITEKQPGPPAPPVAEVQSQPEPEPVEPRVSKPTPVKKAAPKTATEVRPATPPVPYREPVTQRGAGMLTVPIDPMLGSARNELSRSNIPGALEAYGKLIKKARFLDEVIFDLREALYRYPVEVSIWQALGDAYMRANRLQDALDAYTKAEELLR